MRKLINVQDRIPAGTRVYVEDEYGQHSIEAVLLRPVTDYAEETLSLQCEDTGDVLRVKGWRAAVFEVMAPKPLILA